MLNEEYATASNIKNRTNRQSVQSAITSVIVKLKTYSKVPPNGLVIYSGFVQNDDGSEKHAIYDFEPFKPINTKMYMCDKRFHTEPLKELLTDDRKYGFIILDGESLLLGSLSGNAKTILFQDKVSLGSKTRRGGQSAARLNRIRLEKKNVWIERAAVRATQSFITDITPNIIGLVIGGKATCKNELVEHKCFDPRLKKILIMPLHDVSYGGENGFEQTIRMAASSLSNNVLNKEKNTLSNLFSEMSKPNGLFTISANDTILALENGAVKDLIIWDELKIWRHEYTKLNSDTDQVSYKALHLDEKTLAPKFNPKDEEYKLKSSILLTEWILLPEHKFGSQLHIVCDRSSEGSQFSIGLGGIAGILRYPFDVSVNDVVDDVNNDFDDADFI